MKTMRRLNAQHNASLFALLTALLLAVTVAPIVAQANTCPALLQQALTSTRDSCVGLGRNQACYGNTLVQATARSAAPLAFAAPGDQVGVADLQTLATAPLNLASNTWGVAMLALQADIPDTLPGQNVIFIVFGDTRMDNRSVPADAPTAAAGETLGAQTIAIADLRDQPSITANLVGTLPQGETIILTGRTDVGDWLQLDYQGMPAWIYAPLVAANGDTRILPVAVSAAPATADSRFSAPMQAFSLTTGIGEPGCAEAPRDGIVVQSPQGLTVTFSVNGVEVQLGSTAYLRQSDAATLEISNLEGTVSVTANGVTQRPQPGQLVTVPQGGMPTAPVAYDYQNALRLPLLLLPGIITLPAQAALGTGGPTGVVPPVATVAPPPPCYISQPAGWVRYTVQTGDTLSNLAQRTNASVSQIAAVNCISNINQIYAGQTLFLPFTPAPLPAPVTAAPPVQTQDVEQPGGTGGALPPRLDLSAACSGTTAVFVVTNLGNTPTTTLQWQPLVDGSSVGGAQTIPALPVGESYILQRVDASQQRAGALILSTGDFIELSCAGEREPVQTDEAEK